MAEIKKVVVQEQEGQSTGAKVAKAVATPVTSTVTGAFGAVGNLLSGVGNFCVGNFDKSADAFVNAGKSVISPVTDTAEAAGDCFETSPKTTTITATDENGNSKQLVVQSNADKEQTAAKNIDMATASNEDYEKAVSFLQDLVRKANSQSSKTGSGCNGGGCNGGGGTTQASNPLANAVRQYANTNGTSSDKLRAAVGNFIGSLLKNVVGEANQKSDTKGTSSSDKSNSSSKATDSGKTDKTKSTANPSTAKFEKTDNLKTAETNKRKIEAAIADNEAKAEEAEDKIAKKNKEKEPIEKERQKEQATLDTLNNEEKPKKEKAKTEAKTNWDGAIKVRKNIENQKDIKPGKYWEEKTNSEGEKEYVFKEEDYNRDLIAAKKAEEAAKTEYEAKEAEYNKLVTETIPAQEKVVKEKVDKIKDIDDEIKGLQATANDYKKANIDLETEKNKAEEQIEKLRSKNSEGETETEKPVETESEADSPEQNNPDATLTENGLLPEEDPNTPTFVADDNTENSDSSIINEKDIKKVTKNADGKTATVTLNNGETKIANIDGGYVVTAEGYRHIVEE